VKLLSGNGVREAAYLVFRLPFGDAGLKTGGRAAEVTIVLNQPVHPSLKRTKKKKRCILQDLFISATRAFGIIDLVAE
jgi:hypothetical protein